ncbi:MAG TPA: hypothetical protein VLC09_18350 [Polyangiaceae bacterium]|nr:hypothetical protein [Polyangiaceae bacterium]
MTDPSQPPSPSPDELPATSEDSVERALARLARLEAQVRALQDKMSELDVVEGKRRQRSLVVRLALLAVLLGLFFVVRSMQGGR